MTLLLLMNLGFAGGSGTPVVTFNPAWAEDANSRVGPGKPRE